MNEQRRMLVVDDMQAWCSELVELLQRVGFYAQSVNTLSSAYQQLKQSHYDLIILDMRMDAEDETYESGLDLLEKLAEEGRASTLKVIVLSAHVTPEQTQELLAHSSVLAYFSKDAFDEQEFLQHVYKILYV